MVSREARFKRLHTERFCFESQNYKDSPGISDWGWGEGQVSKEQEKIQEVMNIFYYFDSVVVT